MKINKLFLLFLLLPLITGCWDERLLKDARTVYLSGFDMDDEGTYTASALIRNMNISESSRGEISITNEVVTGTGKDIRETSLSIERAVAGRFDPIKSRILMISNKVASDNLYNVLDPIFRDPLTDMNTKIVVTDRSALELIQHFHNEEIEKGEYLFELITSIKKYTGTPTSTLKTVNTRMFDEGKDFIVPYLKLDQEDNKVKIKGTALFHNKSFTGEYLSNFESTLLLLFMNQLNTKAIMTTHIDQIDKAVSYNVKNLSRDLKIEQKDNVHVNISLELKLDIVDMALENMDYQEKISMLNKELSSKLTNKAEALFEKLEQNNSDVLGIGRELMAYHPSTWEEIKGKNYYNHIVVNPEVKVEVISTGLNL